MSRTQEVGVGLLLLAALGATGVIALQLGAASWFGDRIEVVAPAVDVAGLPPGAVVTALGVEVGTVGGISLDGDRVLVALSLYPNAGLRAGVTPRIRPRSLLGEKYVELVPGDPEAPLLKSGDELRPMPPQFEIDELIDVIGPLVGAIDPLVLAELARVVKETHDRDPARFARMLDDVEAMLANGRLASDELPALMTEARSTLGSLDARSDQLAVTLDNADRLLVSLERGTEAVPATVEEARQALAEARALITKLDGAAVDLETVLENFSTLDPGAIEHLLRDEGIRVRFAGRGENR